MAELKMNFNLRLSRRAATGWVAAAMMLCAVPELDSESVTLSTYYPAPSGVYTNMITTGNTYLARDGGNVGIGTISPAQKLHVVGDVQMNHVKFPGVGGDSGASADYYAIYQEAGAWANPYPDLRIQYHTGIKYDAYFGYGGHRFYTGYDGSGNPTGLQFQISDQVYIMGDATMSGTTNRFDMGTNTLVNRKSDCVPTYHPEGVTNCPAGQYASLVSGMMVKRTIITVNSDPTGTMLCCPCPTGGCPSF